MGDPKMGVYPDPDGATRSSFVPSNVGVAGGAIGSGGVAVGAAAMALGPGLITNALSFLQGTGNYPATAEAGRVLGLHGLTPPYVAVILVFGSLSVVLQVANLVMGLRMRERLRGISDKVYQMCRTAGMVK